MESNHGSLTHCRAPRYTGEDTRLTSKREISGWYSYGWAAEVFAVCGVGTGNNFPIIIMSAVES